MDFQVVAGSESAAVTIRLVFSSRNKRRLEINGSHSGRLSFSITAIVTGTVSKDSRTNEIDRRTRLT
jgi:hypothetical protein